MVQAARGVCPLPMAFRPKGQGARRCHLQRSIDVGGRWGEMADCKDDDEDDNHHGRSPPPAPLSAEPGLVPTIGREVAAGGTDVNVGGGGGVGGGAAWYWRDCYPSKNGASR